jgi:hypothetical protein
MDTAFYLNDLSSFRGTLYTYNAEDCEALERVTTAVAHLCQGQVEAAQSKDHDTVHIDTMKRESPYHFARNQFAIPEFEYINKSAYWDYQRDKVYIRSSPRLKRISRKAGEARTKALPVNKVIRCLPPACCPQCKATDVRIHEKRFSKIVYDLKFGRTGVKSSMSKSAARCCPLFGTQEVKAILSHTGGPVFSMIMDSSWGTNGVPSLFS